MEKQVSLPLTTVLTMIVLCAEQSRQDETTASIHSNPNIRDQYLNSARNWKALAEELEEAVKAR
jgi:hypothetical protein